MGVNILLGKPLRVYGNGQNIRDWLHLMDHWVALEKLLQVAKPGVLYDIGGNSQIKNLDIVYWLCALVEELTEDLSRPPQDLITFIADRPGYNRR